MMPELGILSLDNNRLLVLVLDAFGGRADLRLVELDESGVKESLSSRGTRFATEADPGAPAIVGKGRFGTDIE